MHLFFAEPTQFLVCLIKKSNNFSNIFFQRMLSKIFLKDRFGTSNDGMVLSFTLMIKTTAVVPYKLIERNLSRNRFNEWD